jgi:histidyl-tRNA synthetase
LKIPYKEDNSLFFNKSYETNSIWQFKSLDWKIISEGSRHNVLSKNIWESKEIPATWFYIDTKILIEMLIKYWVKIRNKDEIDLSFVQLWDEAKSVVLPLSLKAREAGITTVVSLWTPSMKEQMLNAQRLKAKYIVMVWLVEARNWVFQVRSGEDWTQEEVKKDDLIDYIIDKIWKENLDFYAPEDDFIIR